MDQVVNVLPTFRRIMDLARVSKDIEVFPVGFIGRDIEVVILTEVHTTL